MIEDNHRLAPYAAVSQLFSALSNPARAAIVHQLTDSPRTVSELVEALSLSQPLVSQHLKVLREAHLVRAVRLGRLHRYELADDHVTHVFLDALRHTREQPVSTQEIDDAAAHHVSE